MGRFDADSFEHLGCGVVVNGEQESAAAWLRVRLRCRHAGRWDRPAEPVDSAVRFSSGVHSDMVVERRVSGCLTVRGAVEVVVHGGAVAVADHQIPVSERCPIDGVAHWALRACCSSRVGRVGVGCGFGRSMLGVRRAASPGLRGAPFVAGDLGAVAACVGSDLAHTRENDHSAVLCRPLDARRCQSV